MSSNHLALSVRGLGKNYKIVHNAARPTTLREAIVQRLKHPLGETRQEQETFWALRDVDIDIQHGQVVGIIGRNGAGKSTLLKILSRITTPSTGTIDIHGRISSLLEVGTGFHPELTGRENIYLNGSILGMSRREVTAKFDEIVAFSGVERFLDTPVKRYSSGMYVRLAFAVAAHLDQDILIIDEVLAVGDADFQDKCLGKMRDVSRTQGRTVIYVSHNLATVRSLCDRAILMLSGRVAVDGTTDEALAAYLGAVGKSSALWSREESPVDQIPLQILRIAVCNSQGIPSAIHTNEESIELTIEIRSLQEVPGGQVAFRVSNSHGVAVFTTSTSDANSTRPLIGKGDHHYRVTIPARFLAAGNYRLIAVAHIPNKICYDLVENLVSFTVEDLDPAMAQMRDGREGVVTPILPWTRIEA